VHCGHRLLATVGAVVLVAALAPAAGALVYGGGSLIPRPSPVAPGRPGELVVVPGRGDVAGRGPLIRYSVAIEGGLRIDRLAFARDVERILSDARGWGSAGAARFQRVGAGQTGFVVVLASPATTDALCAPIQTNGRFSCATGARAVLNSRRWRHGADAYARDLDRYHAYMVNHEVGHVLGHRHAGCARAGARAPVMMQQTKGVGACRPNPWPLPWERA
jgi:hypothetical protein